MCHHHVPLVINEISEIIYKDPEKFFDFNNDQITNFGIKPKIQKNKNLQNFVFHILLKFNYYTYRNKKKYRKNTASEVIISFPSPRCEKVMSKIIRLFKTNTPKYCVKVAWRSEKLQN